MNSCNTDIFSSNYYHLQSVRFELNRQYDRLPSQQQQKTNQLKNTKEKNQVLVVYDKMQCCIGGDRVVNEIWYMKRVNQVSWPL